MGTMFKAAGFVMYLVLALVTGRRIVRVQRHVQTVLISDISPGDENDQQYRTEGQKKAMFSSLRNLVRNSVYGVDDDDLFLLYVMCQFDFILWKCERLSSRRGNQQITDQNQQPVTDHDAQLEKNQNIQPVTDQSKQLKIDLNIQPETDQNVKKNPDPTKQLKIDHNVQPETNQNIQTTTDQSKQLDTYHNVQPETDQNVQTTTDQSKQLKIYHNVQPETGQNVQTTTDQIKQLQTDHNAQLEADQNIQTTTDQIKQLETYHNVRLKSDKDTQPTTEKPMQHESFNKKDSEIDRNLSLPVEEYEMIGDGPDPADGMGLAGGLLCQMCSSVKITAEREKCATRFCDY